MMMAFLALAFLMLLVFERRSGLKIVRLVAVLASLVVWAFAQPVPHRAARYALALSPAQRTTQVAGAPKLSEYATGVVTMEDAVVKDARIGFNARLLAMAVLVWLSCSPMLWPSRQRSSDLILPSTSD